MRLRNLLVLVAALAAAVFGLASPAGAATADRWGFAYVDNPTVPAWTNLDPTHQAGSWPAGFLAQGAKLAPGRFLVKFPQIGAGSKGIPHVTAVNRTGHYCEIVRWYQSGVDEIVDVQCFKPGGTRDDSRFTVLWTLSSGALPAGQGSHAYLQYGAGGVVQSYNSTGGGIGAGPLGPVGQYIVKIGGVGLATALAGDVQATAVQPNAGPRRCKIYKWGMSGVDIVAYVFCYDAAGAPVNSEFTVSYHRERAVHGEFAPPKYFGYLWSGGGGPTNFNYPLGVGANTFGAVAPPGRYIVKYPLLGVRETHAQVTASGPGSNYCHLTQLWTHIGGDAQVDVICFDNTGTPTPHQFLSTFTSRI